jgi:apolipoprotein D and lipocalin family protein
MMKKQSLRSIALASLCLALFAGCTGMPAGLEPVRGFEPDRYLGTWYEIARLDHPFERGLEDVSATYGRREDGGLSVRNRGWDPEQGEWREVVGRAYPLGEPDVGSLRVSFFGPFYGGYHILALDRESYADAVVVGPSRDYLWILSRSRHMSEERREELLEVARSAGFDTDALIWVPQERPDPSLRDQSEGNSASRRSR